MWQRMSEWQNVERLARTYNKCEGREQIANAVDTARTMAIIKLSLELGKTWEQISSIRKWSDDELKSYQRAFKLVNFRDNPVNIAAYHAAKVEMKNGLMMRR